MYIYMCDSYMISYARKTIMASTNILSFKVRRQNPELIPPAKAMPHEFKPLSDIDDQQSLRFHFPFIQFYRRNPSMEGKDPVKIIRNAIAKALVLYYPLAGRLREIAARKLVVECTGEGVLFIEADADVTLQQFGDAIYPPIPCLEELLYHVPGSTGITNSPLLLIQVTRLKCNGFIFAFHINHTMCDGGGLAQFMHAVVEHASGADVPSRLPVWERQLLNARNPPHVSCTHHEYDVVPPTRSGNYLNNTADTVQRSFIFGAKDVSALRQLLPPHLRRCSKSYLLAACIWRCRTIAISQSPNEVVKLLCPVDTRGLRQLPEGYYGNAIVFPAAITCAEKLTKRPLQYAVELILKARSEATEEYVKSVADLMVIRGRMNFTVPGTSMVFDLTRSGVDELDFGWGKPLYGGLAKANIGVNVYGATSSLLVIMNNKGEKEICIPVCLPSNAAMEVFVYELELMMETARRTSLPTSPL